MKYQQKLISLAIIITGFSGLISQMLLLREFLIIFSGNEFSIGIILANWLILEAFGCFVIGKKAEYTKNPIATFVGFTLIFSYSLPVTIYLIRILKNILGISVGESIGILPILYSSFILISPVSVAHGALFTFGCKIYSTYCGKEAPSIGKVYIYETIGTIIGGVLWTYFLIPYFNSFQMSIGLAIINFLISVFLLSSSINIDKLYKKIVAVIVYFSLFIGIYLLLFWDANKIHLVSINNQWKKQNIVHYQNSIYGNISVIECQNQYTFFFDGIPEIITPIPDIAYIEKFVHLPLLSHPDPKSVLIISGGAGGVISEILKHPSIELVEYVELDPLILELIKKFHTPLTENELNDNRVSVKYIDGRLFLKITDNKYDLIFIGISEPSDLQTNRFFTKEFFSLAKKKLNSNGIIVITLPGSLTYIPEELKNLNSSIFNTIKSVFSNIKVIPGEGTNLFLSSESADISLFDKEMLVNRLEERNLKTEILIPWYIEHKLNPEWYKWFLESIRESSQKVNYDFKPVGVFYSISYWNSVFTPYLNKIFKLFERINLQMVLIFIVIFVGIIFLFWHKKVTFFRLSVPLCIATTGFAGMIFDLVLIFAFQAIYGYVFAWIGLLVTSFMVGAATGALIITSLLDRIKNDHKYFVYIDIIIIFYSFGLPFIFFVFHPFMDITSLSHFFKILFLLLSFISGFLISAQFPIANKIYLKYSQNLSKTAGLLYSADLLGGWLGGVVAGIIILPVLGLLGTCIVVVLLKLGSFIFLIYKGG